MVISDFEKNGFGDMGVGSIRQIMSVLTDNYRCRLGVNYVVNPAKSVYYIWTCIKPFLDEVLIDKVKLLNTPVPQELFTHCNPYQVEEKYGGKAPNAAGFWPPIIPDAPYNLNESPRRYKIDEMQINLHHQSAESEIVEGNEYEEGGNRCSFSREERILESPRENSNHVEHSYEEVKNGGYVEELVDQEDGFVDRGQEEHLDNAEGFGINGEQEIFEVQDDDEEKERRRQRKAERKERRRLRKSKKGLENGLSEVQGIEIFNQLESEDKGIDKIEADSLMKKKSDEHSVVESDKVELVGCGICNTLPSISFTKKCEVF